MSERVYLWFFFAMIIFPQLIFAESNSNSGINFLYFSKYKYKVTFSTNHTKKSEFRITINMIET